MITGREEKEERREEREVQQLRVRPPTTIPARTHAHMRIEDGGERERERPFPLLLPISETDARRKFVLSDKQESE